MAWKKRPEPRQPRLADVVKLMREQNGYEDPIDKIKRLVVANLAVNYKATLIVGNSFLTRDTTVNIEKDPVYNKIFVTLPKCDNRSEFANEIKLALEKEKLEVSSHVLPIMETVILTVRTV